MIKRKHANPSTVPIARHNLNDCDADDVRVPCRVGHLACKLVDHQPHDEAEIVDDRTSPRGPFVPVKGDQMVWFDHDVDHRSLPGLMSRINAVTAGWFPKPQANSLQEGKWT